jgi:hemoglobin-like flavoprotein
MNTLVESLARPGGNLTGNTVLSPDLGPKRLQILREVIAALVGALDQQELFQSLIKHSGRLHASFGVQPSQYVAFGEALIWALERQFGTAFTPELKEAWRALYAVQTQMLRGGQ